MAIGFEELSTPIQDPASDSEVSVELRSLAAGDKSALDRIAPVVEKQLRQIAKSRLREFHPDRTLNPSALINELYLRLLEAKKIDTEHRSDFFALASTIMRRIVVDYVRKANTARYGQHGIYETPTEIPDPNSLDFKSLFIDAALTKLEKINPRQAKIVELRYFGGLTQEEIAKQLKVSLRTVERELTKAHAWMRSHFGP